MNKTEVVNQVSQKSENAPEICEKVIKAFEKQSEEALIGKFKGIKNNRTDIVTGISEKTGLASAECDKVITAFEEVLGTGLSDKLLGKSRRD